MILSPAEPNTLSDIIFSAAKIPSAGSSQTKTPLPLARPAAFTTTASSLLAMYALASLNLSKTLPSAVETALERISCFAKALSASSWAAAALGPNAFMPAFSKASTAPAASGSSGPITASSTLFCCANCTNLLTSLAPMAMFSPHCFVPALPGAINSLSNSFDWANFHAIACSRPPPPTKSTFIVSTSTDIHYQIFMFAPTAGPPYPKLKIEN